MNTETKRPQNGYSETSNVENLGSDPKALDARDYTARGRTFQIGAPLLSREVF